MKSHVRSTDDVRRLADYDPRYDDEYFEKLEERRKDQRIAKERRDKEIVQRG